MESKGWELFSRPTGVIQAFGLECVVWMGVVPFPDLVVATGDDRAFVAEILFVLEVLWLHWVDLIGAEPASDFELEREKLNGENDDSNDYNRP